MDVIHFFPPLQMGGKKRNGAELCVTFGAMVSGADSK